MSKSIHVVKTALLVNFVICLLKFGAALLTKSAGMMAEAIHSLADTDNQILLLLGYKRSQKPPDDTHPFGYGKEEYFWSFIVAILLFVLGSVYSVYEGIHKLLHPEQLRYLQLNFAILGASIALEGYAWLVAKKTLGGGSLRSTYMALIDSKDANTIVVLVEDTGALIGLTIAFAGNVIAYAAGDPVFDAVSSIFIGGLLLAMAYFLANEMRKLIVGEKIDTRSIAKVRSIVSGHPHVRNIGYIKSMQLGANSCLLAVSVDFEDSLLDYELEQIMSSMTKQIQGVVPEARDVFIQLSNKETCHKDKTEQEVHALNEFGKTTV